MIDLVSLKSFHMFITADRRKHNLPLSPFILNNKI